MDKTNDTKAPSPTENIILNARIHYANKHPDAAQVLYLDISELLKQGDPLPKPLSQWLGKTLQDLALCKTTNRSEIRKILHLSKPSYRPKKTSTIGEDIASIEFQHGCTIDKAIELRSEKVEGKDPKEAIRKEFYKNKDHQKNRKMKKSVLEKTTPHHQRIKALLSILTQVVISKK